MVPAQPADDLDLMLSALLATGEFYRWSLAQAANKERKEAQADNEERKKFGIEGTTTMRYDAAFERSRQVS